jgi:SAM-dependent methyltransferase
MMFSAMWRALEKSALYSNWQSVAGADRMRRAFVTRHLRPQVNDVIVDIGCGPAEIFDYLPPVRYFGFDVNPNYVATANRRYSGRGEFRVLDVENAAGMDIRGQADLVMAIGVLHHLDDAAARRCFALAHSLLKPAGRFVTIDGVIQPGQGIIRRCVLALDRGRHVRRADAYRALARNFFSATDDFFYDDLMKIPTSHFVMECRRDNQV